MSETTKRRWRIFSEKLGDSEGSVVEAETMDEALDQLARRHGYADHAAFLKAVGAHPIEIQVEAGTDTAAQK